jgi:tetratricopeptide (TPR) repeat protein
MTRSHFTPLRLLESTFVCLALTLLLPATCLGQQADEIGEEAVSPSESETADSDESAVESADGEDQSESAPAESSGKDDGNQDDAAQEGEKPDSPRPAMAETAKVDPGQEDLDEAAILRFDARTPRELEAVERLLQSAVKKGLSGENASFAKKMLGSVLLQKAQQLIAALGQARTQQQRNAVRDEAIRTLEEALSNDPELVEALLLIARLNLILPGGDKEAIKDSTTKAIELLADNPAQRSKAYVLRSTVWGPGEEDKRKSDLNAAIKDDPENLDALRARAAIRFEANDVQGAIKDLEQVFANEPVNPKFAEEVVKKLAELDRVDDALNLLSKSLEAQPSEGMYRMRAILHRMQQKDDEALADLNKALAMQPRDPYALLQRSEIAIGRGDVQAAKDDLRSAERLVPQVAATEQAIFIRCQIAIEEGRMADAINEMKTLVEMDPGNEARRITLANLYMEDERPRKAIEVLSGVIDRDPKNVRAYRWRADAYLSVGDHAAAIADYQRALDNAKGDDTYDVSGILNNLAWVLATSPQDAVRDGKRSVELGKRAVELTKENEPHILSTLAAAYAEVGNFEKAVEWSTKAVELGKKQKHEQIEQLEEELESYRKKKPWREKQETEENQVPILSPDDLIET